MKLPFAFIAVLLLTQSATAQRIDTGVHTILFLGNSITYAGNYITDIEACYTIWHPSQKVSFLNLGLPSETISGLSEPGHANGRFPRPDLHERLHRILGQVQPDLIFACYGMNDGIYQPFDENRFQQYRSGMNWLYDTLQKTGARVIILTPPVYDELRGTATGYADVLDRYTDWLLSMRKKAGWEVADIHRPMKKYIAAHRKTDAAFGVDGFALAQDGIHPGEPGHWLIAKQLLLYIHEKQAASFNSVNAAMNYHSNGALILQLIAERQNFMKDAWLTAIGHKRPEMRTGLPMGQAKARSAETDKKIKELLLNAEAKK